MTRQVNFEGKTSSFPDTYTDEEISAVLEASSPPPNTDYSIEVGLAIIAIVIVFLILRKQSKEKLAILYSVAQKIFFVALVLVVLWMLRFEVTPTHPHQCLDRWLGQVNSC